MGLRAVPDDEEKEPFLLPTSNETPEAKYPPSRPSGSQSTVKKIRKARNWIMLGGFASALVLWAFLGDEVRETFGAPTEMTKPQEGVVSDWASQAFGSGRINAKDAEELFLSIPTPEGAIKTSKDFSSAPHLSGSIADFEQAKDILKIFQDELGVVAPEELPLFDAGSEESRSATLSIPKYTKPAAWIDTYYTILTAPLERELQILGQNGSVEWNADVEEHEEDGDEAGKYAKVVGASHGFSKAGDVKGKLIYVNYGSKEDFDELAAKGIDLTGAIAIARYGGLFRGLKVKGAQEAGAAGILIYDDPRDDGTVTVENGYAPYPAGPARNPSSLQRGSVQFLSKYPGDPSTPGYPSYPNVTRQDSLNLPSIPSLPLSWLNAKRLLEELGPTFNGTIDGAKSEKLVRLNNQVDVKVTPIWNTMAVVPGHIKSEVVVLGCHRDAWGLGAGDPISGTATIVEVAKGIGALLKKGWQPLRTLVIASWDAEEPGLIGSTEYGEDFHQFIRDHVVAYINTDVATKGSRFKIGGSPTLAHLLRQAAIDLPHPTDANRTLWDARTDKGKLTGSGPLKAAGAQAVKREDDVKKHKPGDPDDTKIRPLGSGSDYTVFLQRIGVASADIGFGSTLHDPVYHYHSVYDSQRFQEVYADPGFVRHVAVAKHLGLVTLRLLDTPLLPLNTTQYALELGSYYETVKRVASLHEIDVKWSHLEKSIAKLQKASRKLDEHKEKAVQKLERAIEKLRKHRQGDADCRRRRWTSFRNLAKRVFGADTERSADSDNLPKDVRRVIKAAAKVVAVNKKLSSFERGFISKEGIPDREWYRNLVVAPGKWTGYGATTFPALAEAIEIEESPSLAKHETERLTDLLEDLAELLK